MKTLRKISDTLVNVELTLAAILLCALMLTSFTQVMCRFVIKYSIPWAEEACRFSLIWFCFLACPALFSRKKATSVDLLAETIEKKLHIKMSVFLDAVIIFFWGVFGRYTARLISKAIASGQVSTIMKIPYAAIYSVMLICSVLCIFHVFVNLLTDMGIGKKKEDAAA
ncbi:MAG: TRAP transporter small permease subunit [Oscillospiraceae bacterium]|nr:TRAP transporter small permease subunit [Oscillospiraceae bacterium]